MSILFFIISGTLFLFAFVGAGAAIGGENIDETALGLTFISSGIFAIAGVLA